MRCHQVMCFKYKDTDKSKDNKYFEIKRVEKVYAVHTLSIKKLDFMTEICMHLGVSNYMKQKWSELKRDIAKSIHVGIFKNTILSVIDRAIRQNICNYIFQFD